MNRRRVDSPFLLVAVVAATLAILPAGAATAQDGGTVHPEKAAFAGAESWPTIAPGEHPIRSFAPFRAVYRRVYRAGSGGHQVEDRVIVIAEEVAWGPQPAIVVTLIDAGNRDLDDTWTRVQTRVFRAGDQGLVLQLTPMPGTAKSYMVIHADQDTARVSTVTPDADATTESIPNPGNVLGAPGLWIVGSMASSEGQRIRFDRAMAPAPSSILGAPTAIVIGREPLDAGPAGRVDAWVVRYPLGMENARAIDAFVIDRPPYLLGKRPVDLETGESHEIGILELVEFSTFPAR